TRIQHVVLVPAALTAFVLAALLRRERADENRARSVARGLGQHWLLVVSGAAVLVAAGIRALAGGGVLSVAGRYANVANTRPNPGRVVELAVQHLAGIDLALGVFPFVGALVAAIAFS